MTTLDTINKEQPGGWLHLHIVTLEELAKCPAHITNENAHLVNIAPSQDVLDVLPVGESISINETPSETTSGTMYNIKAAVEFGVQSKALDSFLDKYNRQKVVIIGIKPSGLQKMYGSKKFPLTFSYQYSNGKNFEDGSYTRIEIAGKIPQKPVIMSD
ncbi:hypothetical protein HCG49_16975 [Arenibacter sp. 6A1]|uniref:hypothetical protein n=1 Tax=Arenibacter sp. 6A1 TaxID=2720391 RepID=UPI001447958A|nr:hypothetical protein [Arenibacter sp. 6A1]NKI28249.1 hypothetical protein [Arenibacter sp. 6A1]